VWLCRTGHLNRFHFAIPTGTNFFDQNFITDFGMKVAGLEIKKKVTVLWMLDVAEPLLIGPGFYSGFCTHVGN